MRAIFKRIVLCLIICSIFFAFLEIVARLCLRHIYDKEGEYKIYSSFLPQHEGFVEDKYLFWKFSPNWRGKRSGVSWNSNSFGLRDVEFPMKKPSNTFRILSLGESGACGTNVELGETYSKQLEKLLNRDNNNPELQFQVINAGMPSYTSFQGLIYLKRYGLKFQPDLIMTYFVSSDDLPSYFIRNPKPAAFMDLFDYRFVGPGITDRELYIRRCYLSGLLRLLNKSVFYKALAGTILKTKYYIYTQINKDKLISQKRDDFDIFFRAKRVPEEDRRWVFSNFISLAREHSIKLLILIPPYVQYFLEERNPFAWVTHTDDVHILDLGIAFKNSGYSRERFFADSDEAHPSALGYRIAAEAIYDYLVNNDLVPATFNQ